MSDHYKSIGFTLAFFALVFAVGSWCVPSEDVGAMTTAFRFGSPIIIVLSLSLSFWAMRRPDKAPDFLKRMFKKRYDCKGVSFAIDLVERDGVAYFDIYFQNRAARPGQLKLQLSPERMFGAGSRDAVLMFLQCDGGAFGVTHVPFAVPVKKQGKRRNYIVQAETFFPSGRGELLRFHPGRQVNNGKASGGTAALAVLAFGVIGAAMACGRSTTLKLRMPIGAADNLPPDRHPETENLWMPGDEDISLSDGFEREFDAAANVPPLRQAA